MQFCIKDKQCFRVENFTHKKPNKSWFLNQEYSISAGGKNKTHQFKFDVSWKSHNIFGIHFSLRPFLRKPVRKCI